MQLHANKNFPGLLRRLGIAGFVFFLAKGLLWLAVPMIWYLLGNA